MSRKDSDPAVDDSDARREITYADRRGSDGEQNGARRDERYEFQLRFSSRTAILIGFDEILILDISERFIKFTQCNPSLSDKLSAFREV